MSDPEQVQEALCSAEAAFENYSGDPTFEPGVNESADAPEGEVPIQKACRLLAAAADLDGSHYYGLVLETSFIAIEHTLQGYLLALTGAEQHDLQDHDRPYELSRGQVPLPEETLDRLETLYEAQRTDHYYGTTATTAHQAEMMHELARAVHDCVVGFNDDLQRYCTC